jgi:pimeloyl-ACP methyl ester carboxylesterase
VEEACLMLRQGSGEPIVLLHGILNSEAAWHEVAPLLAGDHEVIALTAAGHNGGPAPAERPATVPILTDAAERQLDQLGLATAHLAGNSLGGWMALELARRGRAKSVCGFGTAGLWREDWPGRDRVFEVLLDARRESRRNRRILGPLSRSARFRRWALREAAVHGERTSREYFLRSTDDTIGCDVAEELIVPGQSFDRLEPPCPVTLAMGSDDRFFPPREFRPRAEELVPGARIVVLDDCGHVPMIDDPQLVADTIRESVRRASSPSASLSSPGS